MRCCQNKTRLSWSYRDSSKRSLENNVKSRRGKRKIHTLEIGKHVQMAKSDPEARRKSSLSDCTWLENEYGSFNLEALEFLMHFREPGSSLYFYTYSYIFSFSHIYFFPFSFFLFLIFFFFFLIKFFYLLSWNSKLHCTYLLPHAYTFARPRVKRC
jgi:cellulose synthase/poly-beta-1,6-N-acetylglucosamine synthase-like glycosyltransferase